MNQMPRFLSGALLSASSYVALLLTPAHAQQSTANLIGQLTEDRARAINYVQFIKTFRDTAPKYIEGHRLYNEAQALYSAWTSSVQVAILEDSLPALQNDLAYVARCRRAQKAGKDFEDFYWNLPPGPQSKSGLALLAALAGPIASLTGSIMTYLGAKQKNQADMRLEMAKKFALDTSWPRWDEIPKGSK
jgi:hypothetical protein